jgi:hypothetical protein
MRLFLTTCLLLLAKLAPAQSIGMWGSPPVRNFSPTDYRAGLANWSVAQDRRGVLYLANDKGILEYDGANWQLIGAQGANVRAVATDAKGRVWAGGGGTFGYLAPDSTGAARYVGLERQLPPDRQDVGEIWTVQCVGETVIFQADDFLYLYNNNKLTTIAAETFFSFGYAAGNEYFVQQNGTGLWRLAGDKLALVPGTNLFGDALIGQVLPHSDGKLLLVVQGLGLYLVDNAGARPFATEADDLLKDFRAYTATWLPAPGNQRWLAVGMLGTGLLVLDEAGKLVAILNRRNGLGDDYVLALCPDVQGGLWVGTYRGVDRVELAAPLARFNENFHNLRGTVNAVAQLGDDLYVATSFGLQKAVPRELTHAGARKRFYDAAFGLLRGGKTECWDLLPVDGDLLIGAFDGVKVLRNGTVSQLSDDLVPPNVRVMARSRLDPNRVFAGSAYNLRALYRTNGQWTDEGEIENFVEDITQLQEDQAGNLWVSTAKNGVFRLAFAQGQTYKFSLKPTVQAFGQAQGLPSPRQNGLFLLDGDIRVVAGHQVLHLGPDQGKLAPDPAFAGVKLPADQPLTAWLPDAKGNLRVFYGPMGQSRAALLKRDNQGSYTLHRQARIPDGLLDPGHLYLAPPHLWFADLAGLYRFTVPSGQDSLPPLPAPLIRRVWVPGSSPRLAHNPDLAKPLDLGQVAGPVRIEVAAPLFQGQAAPLYQFALGEDDAKWSDWSGQAWAEFLHVPAGEHVLRVRARDAYGQVTPVAQLTLLVGTAWYQRPLWYGLLGVALLAGGWWGTRKLMAKSTTVG